MSDWRFWIDRGGTFTDVVGLGPDGQLVTRKLLSDNPETYADAGLEAIAGILALAAAKGDTDPQAVEVRIGTTVGTNALLERRGEPTLFVTGRGFEDSLLIGTQHRPNIFALEIRRDPPLYDSVLAVGGRLDAEGHEIEPLDEQALRAGLRASAARGLRSIAIAFLHSPRNPAHEHRAAQLAAEAGFTTIVSGHELGAIPRFLPRASTAVLDGYLSPVLARYLERVTRDARATVLCMRSDGGLVPSTQFRGRDCLLSGPAGGVVGAARLASAAGHNRVIGFDMGGTSTDVFQWSGNFEREEESELAGIRVHVPQLRIHTVAAGGGSLLRLSDGRLTVGPDSAGARPGPACYGHAGPLAITDANLVLGRLRPEYFPRVFGRTGDCALDLEPTRNLFQELRRHAGDALRGWSMEELAEGFVQVAVEKMALAIRRVSTARGLDPREFALFGFGGAGGQHACLVAEQLGITTVLLHPLAGLLSAVGLGLAELEREHAESLDRLLSREALVDCAQRFVEAEETLLSQLGTSPAGALERHRELLIAYDGSDTPIPVDFRDGEHVAGLRERFSSAHEARFGFRDPDRALWLRALRLRTRSSTRVPVELARTAGSTEVSAEFAPATGGAARVFLRGDWHDVPLLTRGQLRGTALGGPALVASQYDCVLIPEGWAAAERETGMLVLERMTDTTRSATRSRDSAHTLENTPDPVTLELYHNRFQAIAEEMGIILQETSASVNIKERLDFSCAVFDQGGSLVANAPHIPVHLGSMADSVRAVLESDLVLRPGDSIVLNDPYRGGTHLPDVTVVTPLFLDDELCFVVASRGHHADIGGSSPGSMPADSTSIDEEGVLIRPTYLIQRGEFQTEALGRLLSSGRWPARNPDLNLADLRAQVAANQKGLTDLRRLLERRGRTEVAAYMQHIQANAAAIVRDRLRRIAGGRCALESDGGDRIAVAVERLPDGRTRFDFTGTSAQSPGNLNAPLPVVRAAVLYVLRLLAREHIPLNSGCFEPIDLVVPAPSLLSPSYPAAVAGGNVETSQLIVDALLLALGLQAAAQGTMNNLSLGSERVQYYETIAGGTGAGDGYPGSGPVQSHMTNSRLTDPEVLERRYPVRLVDFRVRRGSGGPGRFSGGDGAIRELEALEEISVAVLAGRRRVRPPGLAGGSPGAAGRTLLLRPGRDPEELSGRVTVQLRPGERIRIETPGGGGFGPA